MQSSNSGNDRVPPYDLFAERALLGSVLLNNQSLEIVRGLLTVDDFYLDANRVIYQTMLEMAKRQTVIDHVTLAGALRDAKRIENIGGIGYLGDLTNGAIPSTCEQYAANIRNKAGARRVMDAALEIAARACTDGAVDPVWYIDESLAHFTKAAMIVTNRGNARTMDEGLRGAWTDITEGRQPKGIIKTGLASLDRLSNGIWPKQLTILGARPGVGKSAVMLNIATNAALAGHRTLFVTLEDDYEGVVDRQIARFSGLGYDAIHWRTLQAAYFKALTDGYQKACDIPLYVIEDGSITSMQLRSYVLRFRNRHGLDFLCIDHLAELYERADSDTQMVSRAVQNIRDMAKEFNLPVLCAHQLNRRMDDRVSKRPTISDLKQSGKVEEVARSVWLLHREGYYTGEKDRKDAEIIVAKSNHGHTGVAKLYADMATMYIRDWEDRDGLFPYDEVIEPASRSRRKGKAKASAMNGKEFRSLSDDELPPERVRPGESFD